jgi:excisionase family DNA binding protein
LPEANRNQTPEDFTVQDGGRPITVRVREACRLTGIGRSKFYELIKAGEIRVIKVGTITLVPVDSLQQYLGIGPEGLKG